VLTGGGDCPGLNAVIRAIVRKGEMVYGDEILGFMDAWEGVMTRVTMPLDVRSLRGMLPRGGTLLGTRRGSPFEHPEGLSLVKATFEEMGLDALIVVGGNGSLSVAHTLWEQLGLPIVGVPKTIDNDIEGTQVTFGFHTAVQIATDAIDRLHTTAESHDRVMVVEVMGRHAGFDTRVVMLGHVQRGGTPCAYDRVLSTRYGLAAIDAVHDHAWGEMVVFREQRIERAPMSTCMGRTRHLDMAMYTDVAEIFFG